MARDSQEQKELSELEDCPGLYDDLGTASSRCDGDIQQQEDDPSLDLISMLQQLQLHDSVARDTSTDQEEAPSEAVTAASSAALSRGVLERYLDSLDDEPELKIGQVELQARALEQAKFDIAAAPYLGLTPPKLIANLDHFLQPCGAMIGSRPDDDGTLAALLAADTYHSLRRAAAAPAPLRRTAILHASRQLDGPRLGDASPCAASSIPSSGGGTVPRTVGTSGNLSTSVDTHCTGCRIAGWHPCGHLGKQVAPTTSLPRSSHSALNHGHGASSA